VEVYSQAISDEEVQAQEVRQLGDNITNLNLAMNPVGLAAKPSGRRNKNFTNVIYN
jgi:hypothetical protein